MKKAVKITIASITGLSVIGSIINHSQENTTSNETKEAIVTEEIKVCDGKIITTDCEIDGVSYELYLYHPPIEEISHTVDVIKGYNEVVTGYCTLCNDGTRSPTCSTGSGTCSHHGGVKQWNAPIYESVPYYETITVIDQEAKAEWYEMIPK